MSRERYAFALILTGAGCLLLAYWYSRYELIKDYLDELKLYEEALRQAYADGKVDENEQKFLNEMQSILLKKEEAIRSAGLLDALIDAITEYGIPIASIVGGLYITTKIIRYLIKKYRPPKYKCFCGKEFSSESELKEHLEKDHHATANTSKYDDVIEALKDVPDWFKDLVGLITGHNINYINEVIAKWDQLTPQQKVVIGIIIVIAIIIAIAFARWFAFIPSIARLYQLAVACLK